MKIAERRAKVAVYGFDEALNKVEVLTEKDFGDDSAYGCVVPCKPHNIRIIKTSLSVAKGIEPRKTGTANAIGIGKIGELFVNPLSVTVLVSGKCNTPDLEAASVNFCSGVTMDISGKYSVTAYAYNAGSAKTTISHDCDVLIVGECD